MNTAKLKKSLHSAAVLLVIALASAGAQANLVSNGNFEGGWLNNAPIGWTTSATTTGNLAHGLGQSDATGATTSVLNFGWGWNVATDPGPSPAGGKFYWMDSDAKYSGTLKQTLSGLTVGKSYAVSFYQAAGMTQGYFANIGHAFDESWSVSMGGVTQNSQTMTVGTNYSGRDVPTTPWQLQTLTFTATATSTVLGFLAHGPSGVPPMALLDGIAVNEVTAVPEPASFALMALGLLGLGLARRQGARRGL